MPPEQMMEMLMQLLQSPPNEPAGEVPRNLPASGVPSQISQDDPVQGLLQMLMSQVQNTQGMQSGVNANRALQGQQGASGGMLGGRPPGGGVPGGRDRLG